MTIEEAMARIADLEAEIKLLRTISVDRDIKASKKKSDGFFSGLWRYFFPLPDVSKTLDLDRPKYVINIAAEYAEFPGGRKEKDGPYSGARFRDEFLYPALNKPDQRTYVDLTDTMVIPASWLDEVFGSIGDYYSYLYVLEHLEIRSDDPFHATYVDLAYFYIKKSFGLEK